MVLNGDYRDFFLHATELKQIFFSVEQLICVKIATSKFLMLFYGYLKEKSGKVCKRQVKKILSTLIVLIKRLGYCKIQLHNKGVCGIHETLLILGNVVEIHSVGR